MSPAVIAVPRAGTWCRVSLGFKAPDLQPCTLTSVISVSGPNFGWLVSDVGIQRPFLHKKGTSRHASAAVSKEIPFQYTTVVDAITKTDHLDDTAIGQDSQKPTTPGNSKLTMRPIRLLPSEGQLVAFMLLLWAAYDGTVAALPHPAAQPYRALGDDVDHRLSSSFAIQEAPARSSFSPQPQYIVLTPPLLQHDVQKQSTAEQSSQTSAKTRCFAGVRDAPRSGRLEACEASDRDLSSEDWESWRRQFQAQLRGRRCQTHGADCSRRLRRT